MVIFSPEFVARGYEFGYSNPLIGSAILRSPIQFENSLFHVLVWGNQVIGYGRVESVS